MSQSYMPANNAAFVRLTIDGQRMDTAQAITHFKDLSSEAPWCRGVVDTLRDLGVAGMWASTSGTTGPPKRFRIPHEDLISSAQLTGRTFGLNAGDRALLALPCDFIAGKLMLVRAFVLGLDLHCIDPRGSVLQNLRTNDRFRFAALVPLQLHRMLQEDRSRVEQQFGTILLGGGPVSNALTEELKDLKVDVYQSYGSTETVTHVALRRLNGPDAMEHFTAIGDVHFGRDPRGCLVVYTPHLSVSQHVTNDLAELESDVRFRWLGRFDNVILSGGKKIFPEQLEARTQGLIPYPHYFTGVHDDVLGQAVMLVLETERPRSEVMPQVMEHLMGILHPHEWPRRVQTLARLERTSGGKVIRRTAQDPDPSQA